jgi:putative hydrolase of the HAD superfamily
MTSITAVLFDFAGVLTSSPWIAMSAAGGGNLELLIGSYEEDTDHPWHQVERGEMAITDWMSAVTATGKAEGIEVDFTPLAAMLGEMTLHEPIIERVRTLRDDGYKLGLVTNNVREGSATWRAMLPVD